MYHFQVGGGCISLSHPVFMVPKAFRLKGVISSSLNVSVIPLKDKGFIWLKKVGEL